MPPPPRSPGAAAALLLSSLLLASAATAARAEGGAAAAGNRTADDGSAAGRASSFVRWFEDSGGIFHPVPTGGGGLSAAVTVEAFPEYGGYGLSLRVSEDAPRCDGAEDGGATDDADSEEERSPAETDAATGGFKSPDGEAALPIVSHMQSLFTVPSSVIISVSSIMDAHSSEGGEHFLPGFRRRVDSILRRSFPGDAGLARGGMGLVAQDVVMASFLMVEECHHRHRDGLFHGDSRWGPYLDVLPDRLIPRLDSFGGGDYAALADGMLERTGRDSLRTLQGAYDGGEDEGMRDVVADMIGRRIAAGEEVPPSCLGFGTFHRLVAVVSSRAMVLRGTKHLTPLADMINYSPRHRGGGRKGGRRREDVEPPFTLYHSLGRDGGITVRSDRDVHLTEPMAATETDPSEPRVVQLFEDYGPVDSSLFLEAHGFVPRENPHNCATVPGRNFLVRPVPPPGGAVDPRLVALLRALKALGLAHPRAARFDSPGDVCVRPDLSLVDDGAVFGVRPASDAVAVTSLLLGSPSGDVWGPLRVDAGVLADLKERCRAAADGGDRETVELRCARYHGPYAGGGMAGQPLSGAVVDQALRVAARRTLEGHASRGDDGASLRARLEEAESEGNHRRSVALRFRLEEDRILAELADSSPVYGDNVAEADSGGNVDPPGADGGADDLARKLGRFNDFVASLGLPVNKIEARAVDGGMRLGAYATEDVAEGDVYISLPPGSVIDVETAVSDALETSPPLAGLLTGTDESSPSWDGGFDALMLYLLHERFVRKEESRWWPYLDVLPTVDDMRRDRHPLFLPEGEVDAGLGGSDVRRKVLSSRRRVEERHALLASDAEAWWPELDTLLTSEDAGGRRPLASDAEALRVLVSDVLLDGDKVRWAAAVLDTRSIWWDGRRHLVPLLDLVNADGRGRPHATRVEGRSGHAATRASRAVGGGEQLFENYGMPNHVLYGYHGFALEDNPHDCGLLDGLSIGRGDPGAGSPAARRLDPTGPTFCVAAGDESSLDELARFLRVKHGLRPDDSEGSFRGRDVRHLILEVLGARVTRLTDFVEAASEQEGAECGKSAYNVMSMVRRNELRHFTEVIELIQGDHQSDK